MQLGVIGLGRMGGNIVRRLARHGHDCVVYDRSADAVASLAHDGKGAKSLVDLVAALQPPRAVWVMLPAGDATDQAVRDLADAMAPGDIVIDGGNSHYKDDMRRAAALAQKRIHYVDVGTSGGVWGLERGYSMMIGGAKEAVERLDPVFAALAPGLGDIPRTPGRQGRDPRVEHGYLHCGPPGAGHFVKMVHNGIEYGLMQAYAEGFDILRHAEFPLDLADIAEVWRRGSVVASWLLDLTSIALAKDPQLDAFTGHVEDSGEGRWTVMAAVEEGVPADTLARALFARFRSRADHPFGEKLLSAMRNEFGGHVEPGAPKHG